MVKAVVFTAEDTLYTPVTEPAYREKFTHIAEETGIDVERIQEIWEQELDKVVGTRSATHRKHDHVLKRTLTELEFDADDRDRIVRSALTVFWNRMKNDVKPNEDVEDVVSRLTDYYRILAVAANEFREPLEMKLNQVFGDWRQYFDFIVTPDETGLMKPSAVYYSSILSQTRFKPEDVVVIGDDWHHDLKPAQNLGLHTILVDPQKTGNPDIHIESLTQLEHALKQLHTD